MITKLVVDNFRNIEHFECLFAERAAISGKNKIGKTNLIEAIYWALTDNLLDNSSDSASIKPLSKHDALCSVVLYIKDANNVEHKFKKTLQENWVKTRGSDESKLVGHITKYEYDDIPVAIKDVHSKLSMAFGLPETYWKSDIDPFKALVNPLYLTSIKWQDLRKFIIETIGDIKDSDIISLNPQFAGIASLLTKYNGNTADATTFLNKQISLDKDKILTLNSQIDLMSQKKDMDLTELKSLQALKDDLNSKKSMLKFEDVAKAKNDSLKAEFQNIEAEKQKEREQYDRLYEMNRTAKYEYQQAVLRRDDAERLKANAAKNLDNEKCMLSAIENQIKINEDRKSYAEKEIADTQSKIDSNEGALVCPKCGTVVKNEMKDYFQKKIAELKTNITNFEAELTNLNSKWEIQKANILKAQKDFDDEMAKPIPAVPVQPVTSIVGFSLSMELKERINAYNASVENAKNEVEQRNRDIANQISELNVKISELDEKLSAHTIYEDAQKTINLLNQQKSDVQSDLTAFEQNKALLLMFVQTKLNVIHDKVKEIFGDVDFRLVENNIKEGSWNEVCYPLIIGKKTEFVYGSSSEKIETGISIIESLKKHWMMPDLPIIFDECETFDTEHLADTLKSLTKAQIICAKVSDKYDTPTMEIL